VSVAPHDKQIDTRGSILTRRTLSSPLEVLARLVDRGADCGCRHHRREDRLKVLAQHIKIVDKQVSVGTCRSFRKPLILGDLRMNV
jgi:hypothetical protein